MNDVNDALAVAERKRHMLVKAGEQFFTPGQVATFEALAALAGEVLALRSAVEMLEAERAEALDTVEALAMQAMAPHGDGWCDGGISTFEDAAELLQRNRPERWRITLHGMRRVDKGCTMKRTNEDHYRASGDVTCDACGKTYYKHPWDPELGYDGQPFLRLLCNGDRVKL